MSTASVAIDLNRSKQGMMCLTLSLFLFSFQDMVIKSFSDAYSVLQIVFIRSLVSLILLCLFALVTVGVQALVARQPGVLLIKGVFYFFAFTFYYMAYPSLPVADVVAITFLAPVIVTLLSIFLLKEKVGLKIWCAIFAGFAGVVIVVGPQGKFYNIGSSLALACALTYATGSVVTRYLTKGDRPVTIAIYSMFVLMFMSGACYLLIMALGIVPGKNPSIDFLVREWVCIGGRDMYLLLFISLLASFGFYLHSRAYLIAPASRVAPFEYTYVAYTVLLAYLIFGEVPSASTLLGLAVLISASLYIYWAR